MFVSLFDSMHFHICVCTCCQGQLFSQATKEQLYIIKIACFVWQALQKS